MTTWPYGVPESFIIINCMNPYYTARSKHWIIVLNACRTLWIVGPPAPQR